MAAAEKGQESAAGASGSRAADGQAADWRALAGRLAGLGSIAGETAHRFNNLRAVIAGTLELIANEPGGPRLAQRLERIRDAAAQAQALAERLVATASAAKGGGESRIDLCTWLDAARPWLNDLVGEGKGVAIERPEAPVLFLCDPGELRSALTALVLNAAASLGPAGKVRICLKPRPLNDSGTVLLSVVDDGIGMPPELANRVREPFFTTRPRALGLGLSAAEAFASRNGGGLELVSAPGQGTVVSLFLEEAAAS